MAQNRIVSGFFIALLLFVAYHCLLILSVFYEPIFWGSVLAFCFYPIFLKLKSLFGERSTPAAALTTLLIVVAVAPLVVFIITSLASEAVKGYELLTAYIEDGRLRRMLGEIGEHPIIRKIQSNYLVRQLLPQNTEEILKNASQAGAGYAVLRAGEITKNFLLFFVNLLLTFFLTFFLLKDGKKIYAFIYDITPLAPDTKEEVFRQVRDTFMAVLHGQLFTALVQAVISGLVFWALGVPLPVLFAALTFIFSLIPITGAATVWAPITAYLYLTHHPMRALVLLLLGIFVISFVDNFLKPFLIGEKTKLPYILLFLGILGGLKIYGLMGVFLAPTVLSVFFALVKSYKKLYGTDTAG